MFGTQDYFVMCLNWLLFYSFFDEPMDLSNLSNGEACTTELVESVVDSSHLMEIDSELMGNRNPNSIAPDHNPDYERYV